MITGCATILGLASSEPMVPHQNAKCHAPGPNHLFVPVPDSPVLTPAAKPTL